MPIKQSFCVEICEINTIIAVLNSNFYFYIGNQSALEIALYVEVYGNSDLTMQLSKLF
jgi:hypothetical protein